MEALIIVTGSLLVGLIFLLASERQISLSRKVPKSNLKEKDFPLPRNRRRSRDEYDDIFYPRDRRIKMGKASDLAFEDPYYYDYEDLPVRRKDKITKDENEGRKGNIIGAYLNFMVLIITAYLLFKYFSS